MISVTENAKQELKRLLDVSVDWPGARLRLIDRGHDVLGIGIDIKAADDVEIECDGDVVMVIDPELASCPKLIILDVDDTPEGPELVISEEAIEQSSLMDNDNVLIPVA